MATGNQKTQSGRMSLEEVMELYDGQDIQSQNEDNNIIIPEEEIIQQTQNGQIYTEAPVRPERKQTRRRKASFAEASSWFQTICWLNIPVFGFFYILALLIRRRTPVHKKNFIIGYIMYKALVWLLAAVLVYWLYKSGLDFIDGMLKYIT
ncbi:MAG: hypothetical protein OSJ45_13275 [Lachnospiraceae bacterium]|nr:hypothetical protein [Lachnospiraceae bacterium]